MDKTGMRLPLGILLIALTFFVLSGFSIVSAADLSSEQNTRSTMAVTQDETDKALEVILNDQDLAEILSGKSYELVDIETYFNTELEVTISFVDPFEYRNRQVFQTKVFVDIGEQTVVGYYLLDRGTNTLLASAKVVLTEKQEQRGLEIALADPLVSHFLGSKEYAVTRIEGMQEWSSDFTGKPGVSVTFTLNKEYEFEGDIYYPPYYQEETYYLKGSVDGLDVIVNLQWEQVVHMWPHVTSVPIPLNLFVPYIVIIALGLLAGAAIYYRLRRAGYGKD